MDATARRALVIDDEGTVRYAMVRWFRKQGFDVDEAPDGTAALGFLFAEPPPSYVVIVCDWHMPGVAGTEVYAAILERRPELAPRFIFSSGDSIPDIARLPDGSRCPVLLKPFSFDHLRAAVAAIVPAA